MFPGGHPSRETFIKRIRERDYSRLNDIALLELEACLSVSRPRPRLTIAPPNIELNRVSLKLVNISTYFLNFSVFALQQVFFFFALRSCTQLQTQRQSLIFKKTGPKIQARKSTVPLAVTIRSRWLFKAAIFHSFRCVAPSHPFPSPPKL